MSDTSIAPDLELCLAGIPCSCLAQELRYRVFYEEMGARANPATRAAALDADRFDDIADHLVVVDRSRSEADRPFVVGCYRLLRGRSRRMAASIRRASSISACSRPRARSSSSVAHDDGCVVEVVFGEPVMSWTVTSRKCLGPAMRDSIRTVLEVSRGSEHKI